MILHDSKGDQLGITDGVLKGSYINTSNSKYNIKNIFIESKL